MSEPPSQPYPGLRPFEKKDRPIFFGREPQIVTVLSMLAEHNFVAVIGSSGSGKSSIVRAGVVPAVERGFLLGTSDWKIVISKPGDDPYLRLAGKLLAGKLLPEELLIENSATKVAERLRMADRSLVDLLTGEASGDSRFLIIVDQFEELFAFRRPEAATADSPPVGRDDAASFVRMLLRTAAEENGRIAVVMTMRSDFIGDCDAFLGLPEAISRHQFLVPRLDQGQMKKAIEQPGRVKGSRYGPFRFADGLVDKIIAEAGDRFDQLPLMQHTLMCMWKAAGGPRIAVDSEVPLTLTAEHYQMVGRIDGALSQHANQAWQVVAGDKRRAEITRQLFLLLCDVREDGKITRRRPQLSEVLEITGATPAEIEEIVILFQRDDRNFLLPPLKHSGQQSPEQQEHLSVGDRLDISHEALLRQWSLYRDWMKEETLAKAMLNDLSRAAGNESEEDWWTGRRLNRLNDWFSASRRTAAWAKRHGITNWDKCLSFQENSKLHDVKEEEEERRLALRDYQLKLEQKARAKAVRFAWGVAVGSVLLLFALLVVIVCATESARDRATEAKERADAYSKETEKSAQERERVAAKAVEEARQQLATISFFLQKHNNLDKLQTAATALENAPAYDRAKVSDFRDAFQEAKMQADALKGVAYASDLRRQLESLQSRKSLRAAFDASFNSLRQTLVVEKNQIDKALLVLNAPPPPDQNAQAATLRINGQIDALNDIYKGVDEFEKDLSALAQVADTMAFVGLAPLAQLGSMQAETQNFQKIASDYRSRADGLRTDLRAKLNTQKTPTAVEQWAARRAISIPHPASINALAFGPSGSAVKDIMVTAGADKKLMAWKLRAPQPELLKTLSSDDGAINALAFNRQGDTLAIGGDGNKVRFYSWTDDQTHLSEGPVYTSHKGAITSIRFNEDGRLVASASADKTVRVFEYRSGAKPGDLLKTRLITDPPFGDIAQTVRFAHKSANSYVASCSDDGQVRILDYNRLAYLWNDNVGKPSRVAEFSPDDEWVLGVGADQYLKVWSTWNFKQSFKLSDSKVPVRDAAFRPAQMNGARSYFIASAWEDGTVRFWDFLSDPKSARSIPVHQGGASFIVWSADGHWLVSSGQDGVAVLWNCLDPANPQQVCRLQGGAGPIRKLAFSGDAHWVAISTGKPATLLWDVSSLTNPVPFKVTVFHWGSGAKPETLGTALKDAGWPATVAPPRTSGYVPDELEVRYFRYPEGEARANAILDVVRKTLPGIKARTSYVEDGVKPSDLPNYEIWFGKENPPAPN